MQALEYLRSIQVGRMVTNKLGLYHIISGAFGAFDTEILREVGGWDIGPGLDGDITQKFRKAGYKVHFAEDAICMTNVPESGMRSSASASVGQSRLYVSESASIRTFYGPTGTFHF